MHDRHLGADVVKVEPLADSVDDKDEMTKGGRLLGRDRRLSIDGARTAAKRNARRSFARHRAINTRRQLRTQNADGLLAVEEHDQGLGLDRQSISSEEGTQ